MKTRAGYSLVEMLIAAALLGIAGAAVMNGINELNRSQTRAQNMTGRDKQIASLIENIRTNIGRYQAVFDHTGVNLNDRSLTDYMLTPEQLPIAWSASRISTPEQCSECKGRFGYVIQPVDGMRGLYQVVVRVTNPELFEGYRDYKFIVGTK